MSTVQMVVFGLGQEQYAIPIEQVREIINYVPVTKLPDSPNYFEGIINVRGKIVSVVDFATKLGIRLDQEGKQIVIVEVLDKEIGLTVDMVTEVIQIDSESYAAIDVVNGEGQDVQNVCKFQDRIIILLDIKKILWK